LVKGHLHNIVVVKNDWDYGLFRQNKKATDAKVNAVMYCTVVYTHSILL